MTPLLEAAGAPGSPLGRALARFMSKHIPGNPTITPQNMPGAGGLAAANFLYNVARPDGLTLATFGPFNALEPLTDEDLACTVTIRGETHSVMQAINRQVAHYAHHAGQIVLLAMHFAGGRWQSLSVPRGQSAEFNRRIATGEASQR